MVPVQMLFDIKAILLERRIQLFCNVRDFLILTRLCVILFCESMAKTDLCVNYDTNPCRIITNSDLTWCVTAEDSSKPK